jgi:hypothetical protein
VSLQLPTRNADRATGGIGYNKRNNRGHIITKPSENGQ